MGEALRASTITKAASAAAATPKPTSTSGAAKPCVPPSMTAPVRANKARIAKAWPGQSKPP